jgi:hypothetical protein
MYLLRLSQRVHDEPSSVRFLQDGNIFKAERLCDDDHEMKLCCEDQWL